MCFVERVVNYHRQHFVDVDGSADEPRWIMSEARQMRKLHPAALAESQAQDSAVERVCQNNNCVDDENGGANGGGEDDDDDDVVFSYKNSSGSSSSHSSGGLDGACRRLITEKDAANRRWLSLAWKNNEKSGFDSATSVDDRDNVPHPEQDNSRRVDDAADCSYCNDAGHTTDEV